MANTINKRKNTNIEVYYKGLNPNNNLKIYKLTNSGQVIDVTSNRTISTITPDEYYYVPYTTDNDDSIILFLINNEPVFVKVGEPTLRYVLYTGEIDKVIPYTRLDVLGNLLESGNLQHYGIGLYGYIPDSNIHSIITANDIPTILATPYIGQIPTLDSIQLERGVWQLIAIEDTRTVKEAFLDKLATQQNVPITDLVEVCSAYPGHLNIFLSYVPGVTSITSIHNFKLLYDDQGSKEITAFWVKCKEWTHTNDDIVFTV